MSEVVLNSNICKGVVMDDASVEEVISSNGEDFTLADPDETRLEYDLSASDLEDEDVIAAIDELEGDEYAVAQCRAVYDLNELEGGFCCQALMMTTDGQSMITTFLSDASGVTLQEGDAIDYEGMYDVTWGAEAFASASSIGASVMTLAATALVFAQ